MKYKALLAVILVVFIAYMGFSHGNEVSGYKEAIEAKTAQITRLEKQVKKLKAEGRMRDSRDVTRRDELEKLISTVEDAQLRKTLEAIVNQAGGKKK